MTRKAAYLVLLAAVAANTFSIVLMQVAYGLALLVLVAAVATERSWRLLRMPIWQPFLLFVIVSVLATVTSLDRTLSLSELRGLLNILAFYLTVNTFIGLHRALRLAWVLLAAGSLSAVVGLVQLIREGTDFRIFGTLSHYMTYSGMLVIAILVGMGLGVFEDRLKPRLWIVLALIVMGAALMYTQTRSAWVGLTAGTVLLIAIHGKRYLPAVPVLILGVFLISPSNIQERMIQVFDLENVTTQERVFMWSAGWNMFREHPVTGVGPAVPREVYETYRAEDDPMAGRPAPAHLHSNVVQILAERGMLGLLAWALIWPVWLFRVIHVYSRTDPEDRASRGLLAGSVAACFGFLVAGLFEYNFGDSEVITLLYVVMALPFTLRGAFADV